MSQLPTAEEILGTANRESENCGAKTPSQRVCGFRVAEYCGKTASREALSRPGLVDLASGQFARPGEGVADGT
jgi:hypothetical protein